MQIDDGDLHTIIAHLFGRSDATAHHALGVFNFTRGPAMTLFEKYGGVPTVSRIVSAFYREVMSRPTLKPYFEGIDLVRLIEHQVKFISHVLGQPASVYEGRALGTAHMAAGITGQAFAEVAQILESTLVDAGMAPDDVEVVMGAVAGARGAIVTR